MLIIVWLLLTVAGVGSLIGGIMLKQRIGLFLFFIGTAILISTGALLYAEGLQVEEQAIIQDAPDINAGAKVIDFIYTSYTAANSLSIQILSFIYAGFGLFFFAGVLILDIFR